MKGFASHYQLTWSVNHHKFARTTNQSFDSIPSPYTEDTQRSILFYLSDFFKADIHFYLLFD